MPLRGISLLIGVLVAGCGLGGCFVLETAFTGRDAVLEISPAPTVAGHVQGAAAITAALLSGVDQTAQEFRLQKATPPDFLTKDPRTVYLAYYSRRDIFFEISWIYLSVIKRADSPLPIVLITGNEASTRVLNRFAKSLTDRVRQQVPDLKLQMEKRTVRYGRF